ncbi:extracellular superoxide dismutase [Cu-Zn]-like [Gastrophryne carolinensis]
MIFLVVILVTAASFGSAAEPQTCEPSNDTAQKINDLHGLFFNTPSEARSLYSTCQLQPNPKLNSGEIQVTGQVFFKQDYPCGKLEAFFSIHGFPLDRNQSVRAIHIHELGDLSNGCDSAGAHYNPLSVKHPNHVGDFGNFAVKNGSIQKLLKNLKADLFGQFSVMGRSVVVHKMADDLGKGNNTASKENGNAGPRLACCVIGATTKASWEKAMAENAKLKAAKQTQTN